MLDWCSHGCSTSGCCQFRLGLGMENDPGNELSPDHPFHQQHTQDEGTNTFISVPRISHQLSSVLNPKSQPTPRFLYSNIGLLITCCPVFVFSSEAYQDFTCSSLHSKSSSSFEIIKIRGPELSKYPVVAPSHHCVGNCS